MASERFEFEKWAVTILGSYPNWRESGDCELAWQSWQARAALDTQPDAIKLPPRKKSTGVSAFLSAAEADAYNMALDHVEKLNAVRGAEHDQ